MKRIFIACALFGLFSTAEPAYGCSCLTGDPPLEFNRAKAVFIGQMLGGTEKLTEKDERGQEYSIEAGAVRFTVDEVFKGSVAGEVTIGVASMNGTSCGPYGLTRGERYLVYAYGDEKDEKALYTGVCTRTREVKSNYAREDLEFLRNLPPPGTGGNLRGRIWADLRAGGVTPLPGVKVKISGEKKVLTVVTDKEGSFEVKKLKAGTYVVEPELPANYTTEQRSAEVTIDDRGTAGVGFELYADGKVSGRVVDKNGLAFNSVFLHLVGQGKTVYGHSTGEDGGFEVEGVPPGEYVLYLEMQSAVYKENVKFYYPGTFRREDAAIIKVGRGEKIEGINFMLPDESRVRTLEGQVTWKDGSPAAGVQVMLLCPRNSKPEGHAVEFGPTTTTTDEDGRFHLEAFTGETYWIEARGSRKSGDEEGAFHSPPRKIILSDSLKDLKLSLSEKGFSGGCEK